MSKPLLVVVELDEKYLQPLELRLAELLHEKVDIEVISEQEYLEQFFSVPRSIDVLIIDEMQYGEEIKRHNIQKTVILTEELEDTDGELNDYKNRGNQLVRIFKYLKLQVLIGSIVPTEWSGTVKKEEHTQVIAIMAPAGGMGCTTLALGICACLRQNMKRVLYINVQSYQNFQYYFKNQEPLPSEAYGKLRNKNGNSYVEMKPYIRHEMFSYLPPMASPRNVLNISEEDIVALVQSARKVREYDDIIIDVGAELTEGLLPLLDNANKVLVVTKQDAYSAFKLKVMLHNINCSNAEKFSFICNGYDEEADNAYVSGKYKVTISEYVKKIQDIDLLASCKDLIGVEGLQKVAYTLL